MVVNVGQVIDLEGIVVQGVVNAAGNACSVTTLKVAVSTYFDATGILPPDEEFQAVNGGQVFDTDCRDVENERKQINFG